MKKNVASQVIGAQLVSATDGSAFTGSVTVAVTGDAGTQATGSVGSGACTHEGNGFHTYAPAQAETNYDHVAFTFTGTGAVPVTIQIYTSFPQTGDSFARIGSAGAGLTAVPWNASWDAEVQSEVQDAIEVNHLDHLLAATYDPASKPGAADALLNELVESDAGVARFTANSLEQAPTGGGDGGLIASGTAAAIAATTITLASGHGITDTTVQVILTGGTNAVGKARIATYSGTGDVFNVDPAWNATVAGNAETTPSGTITYDVYPAAPAPSTYPLTTNVTQLGGDAQSLTDLKDFADAGYDPATNKVQGVVLTDTATNLTNAPGAGDFTATMKTSIGTAVAASAVASVTGNVGGNVTGSVGSVAAGGITAASIATGAFDADALATDAVTEIVTGVLTSAMTEAYPTDGSTMTVAQALYLIAQSIGEFSVSGTTVTVKRVDGTTTAATYTLDSSTAPTSRTRAT